MEISLKYPFEYNGREIKTLTIRRPKARDMLAIDKINKGDAEKEITLFANLCEVEPEVIGNLDMADYGKLQEAWKSFLS